jgi:hypothetical protein
MNVDHFQSQRFELKYFIPERLTQPVRDFVAARLVLDEFCLDRPNNAYPIHSLYLDSNDFAIYWASINGTKNRYKLRIRYYTDDPAAPVYFEIKRRCNEAILKQRAGVSRAAAASLLAGQLPAPSDLVEPTPPRIAAVHRFNDLMLGMQARPKVHVAYLREAWVSPNDNSLRVTMDREVCSGPERAPGLTTEVAHPVRSFAPEILLEIKFTGRFPLWLEEFVRFFGLQRSSASKYCDGTWRLSQAGLLEPRNRWLIADFPPTNTRAPNGKVQPLQTVYD